METWRHIHVRGTAVLCQPYPALLVKYGGPGRCSQRMCWGSKLMMQSCSCRQASRPGQEALAESGPRSAASCQQLRQLAVRTVTVASWASDRCFKVCFMLPGSFACSCVFVCSSCKDPCNSSSSSSVCTRAIVSHTSVQYRAGHAEGQQPSVNTALQLTISSALALPIALHQRYSCSLRLFSAPSC
jgi:hypothetical protein